MADLKKDDAAIVARRAEEDRRLAEQRRREDAERVAQRKKQDAEAAARRSHRELVLLVAIIAFGVVFLVVIFIFNIVITHRTAGPLFKMGRYMDEVKKDRFTEVWNLRKGDQLVDFYSRFQAMHKALVDRVKEDIQVLSAAVEALEKAGVEGEAVDSLKRRLEAKRASLATEEG